MGIVLYCFLPVAALGAAVRPNVILCMADDLGWGSVGFNGAGASIGSARC